jgi:putative oxidoreductase
VSAVQHNSGRVWQRLGAYPWVVVLARGVVGGVFVVAGFSKLLLPHAEVVALMQQYTVIPTTVIPWLAALLPWLELVSGTALVVGFCTTPAALLVGAQLIGFSGLMLVVLGLGVPIEDCGCFGNLGLHETPLQVLLRDLALLVLLVPVLVRQRDVLALDGWGTPPEQR